MKASSNNPPEQARTTLVRPEDLEMGGVGFGFGAFRFFSFWVVFVGLGHQLFCPFFAWGSSISCFWVILVFGP